MEAIAGRRKARSGRARGRRDRRGRALFAALAAAPLACAQPPDDARSVLLIVVDTLRADHLGAYGYARATSPRLDRWAARGALFEQALAASPWTLPSFASIYTGRLPSRHGAGAIADRARVPRDYAVLDASLPTLAELLADRGYATHALVSNPWLHEDLGMARGFESYDYASDRIEKIRWAPKTTRAAIDWLDAEGGRPFLLLVNYMEPHLAYSPPKRVRGHFTAGYLGPLRHPVRHVHALRERLDELDAADRRFIAGAYDEELLGLDRFLGRLLDRIEQRGLLERTLVVLTSDHGEELFDHGGFEHGHSVHQELLRVPLVFWGAGVAPARIAAPVSHLDLLPTILEALGIPAPEGLPGLSLWPALERGAPLPDRALLAEGTLYGPEQQALLRWPWKAMLPEGGAAPRLYHLADDPTETRDLAAAEPARLAALLAELRALAASAEADRPRKTAEIPAATREQLRELGYLE